MYADDFILLSISLHDLQYMLNICSKEFDDIGMTINSKKSSCRRIGIRHDATVIMPIINGQMLLVKQELSYLGIIILEGKTFKINFKNI